MQLVKYLSKHPKKYLIFDFDETIAEIQIDWSQYRTQMAKVFAQFDPNFHQRIDFHSHDDFNEFVIEYGEEAVVLIKKANQKYEREMSSGFKPNPEIIEFIKQADEYSKFIYSSNSRASVEKGLKELGISDDFKSLVTRDDVSYIKPDPEGFLLIYDPNTPKEDYLMIGNSHSDKDMAKAAGIDFYLVEYFRPI